MQPARPTASAWRTLTGPSAFAIPVSWVIRPTAPSIIALAIPVPMAAPARAARMVSTVLARRNGKVGLSKMKARTFAISQMFRSSLLILFYDECKMIPLIELI